jgi:hypothetical protein
MGEYYFNKTIAEAFLRSLKKSGEVEPFNSITPRLPLSWLNQLEIWLSKHQGPQ